MANLVMKNSNLDYELVVKANVIGFTKEANERVASICKSHLKYDLDTHCKTCPDAFSKGLLHAMFCTKEFVLSGYRDLEVKIKMTVLTGGRCYTMDENGRFAVSITGVVEFDKDANEQIVVDEL